LEDRILDKGLKSLLDRPALYSWVQNLLGAQRARRIYVSEYLRVQAHDRVLDIGCGPADILEWLPDVEYLGLDLSTSYIEQAKRRFGHRAQFMAADVASFAPIHCNYFDVVNAMGVLHHLNDEDAIRLLRIAHTMLRPGGRLVTYDGCYLESQSRLARFFLNQDRGQHIRDKDHYVQLASEVFGANVKPSIRNDLPAIPYTHLIMECQRTSQDAW
jgi:SAM-dependent methyltransferase